MLKIDEKFLIEVGLGDVEPNEKQVLLKQIYSSLESRVGKRIMVELTEVQLKEFEQIIDTKNASMARKWLESNYPKYKDVVGNELTRLKSEIMRDAEKIKKTIKQDKN